MGCWFGYWSRSALRGLEDLGQWENVDQQTRWWYQTLMMPDNPAVSCCGESDAYWADSEVNDKGQYVAIITDPRPDGPLRRKHIEIGTKIVVPNNKLKFGPNDPQGNTGNPTGHGLIFLSVYDTVYCYLPPGGV